MPPLTGVGERCAPRATWSCIDEHYRSPVALALRVYPPSQGSGRAASLAPRSWHERAFEYPDWASSSQGCADRACGSQGQAAWMSTWLRSLDPGQLMRFLVFKPD